MRVALAKLAAIMALSAPHAADHAVSVLYPGPGAFCGQSGLTEARADHLRIIRPVDCNYWGDGRYAPVFLVYADTAGLRLCWEVPRSAGAAALGRAQADIGGGRVVVACPRGSEPFPVFGRGPQ